MPDSASRTRAAAAEVLGVHRSRCLADDRFLRTCTCSQAIRVPSRRSRATCAAHQPTRCSSWVTFSTSGVTHRGFEAAVADVLQQYCQRGVAFMAGNRDFLVGVALLRDCGMMALARAAAANACIAAHAWRCPVPRRHAPSTSVRNGEPRTGAMASSTAAGQRRELAAQMRDASMRHQRDQRPETWADLDLGTTVSGSTRPVRRRRRRQHWPAQELAPGSTRAVAPSDWDLDTGPARAEVLRLSLDRLERVAPARAPDALGRWWRTRAPRGC